MLLILSVLCVMDFALFAIIICFLCPMLPVSVDCSFLYLSVTYVCGLFILVSNVLPVSVDCSFWYLTFINYYSSLPLYQIHTH